jgi:ABC-type multidrug transport system ATPase subunit
MAKILSRKKKTNNNNIEFKMTNVKKSYGKKDVLKGIDFSLSKGEKIAIIGPNGSGKSTLINIITGLVKTYSGKVEYLGFKDSGDFLFKTGVQFQENN